MAIEEHSEAIDALYLLHPREFVAARNELGKRIRTEDREASDWVRKLARPSVAAWALNTVAMQRSGDVDDLRSTGPAIARAQEQAVAGDGASELRRLTEHRRRLVRSLADDAVELVGDAHRDEIEETLQAASIDADVGDLLGRRRLSTGHAAPTGLEDLAGLLTASTAAVRSTKGPDEHPPRRDATSMDAWVVDRPGPIDGAPLVRRRREIPAPAADELLVRVSTCGVCRTDLHVVEGDLPVHRPHVVPGHEVVGRVEALGSDVTAFAPGQRVGVAWLRRTCGTCRFCTTDRENLCVSPRFTGWDDDGGYAELVTVPAAFAHRIPDEFDDVHAAPLLCAGIIGFRALERAEVPTGGRLGIYGFGGSAHLAAQIALHRGAVVHVLTRSEAARQLALDLGCASAGAADDDPPERLDSAILFAPVGHLVLPALGALDRGGTLAIAGIHLSDIPPLHYQDHLFQERQVRSVTANTRDDATRFLAEAAEARIRVHAQPYPFGGALDALRDLAHDRVDGAAVLVHDEG